MIIFEKYVFNRHHFYFQYMESEKVIEKMSAVNGSLVPALSSARRLEGKVALITGGAAGAGKATARLFVLHGAKVVLVDIVDDAGRAVASSIGSEDVVTYIHGDVTVEDDVKNAVDFAVAKYGRLDVMFNNAGIVDSLRSPITGVSTPDFERVLAVNVTGVFLGMKHAARVMLASGCKGSIINSGSVASVVGGVATHAYVASKHAVAGLTKSAAAELGLHGIRVNCLSSFMYASSLSNGHMSMDGEKVEELIGGLTNLKGAVLKAEDVAEVAVFLASDEAKYVSGHNLVVDGGLTVVYHGLDV